MKRILFVLAILVIAAIDSIQRAIEHKCANDVIACVTLLYVVTICIQASLLIKRS